MSYFERLNSIEEGLESRLQEISYPRLEETLARKTLDTKKKHIDGCYWINSEFMNSLEGKDRKQHENYLHFFSSPNVERNIEMLSLIDEDQNWSKIASTIDYEIDPKHISVKAGEMTRKDILKNKKNWAEPSKDMIEAYNHYKKQLDSEKPFKELIDVSKSKGSREILQKYNEDDRLSGKELKNNTEVSWPTFYQHSLPRMDQVGLIEWIADDTETQGRTTYIDRIIEPKTDFNTIKQFLGATESIIKRHY